MGRRSEKRHKGQPQQPSARVNTPLFFLLAALLLLFGSYYDFTVLLAGAGLLRGTIGAFGALAVLAACAYPFLQLGVQYLLFKLTAFLASSLGAPGLCKLIDGLGGAFGLILGMTGSCAVLLLVSILASVGAVTP